MISFFHEVGGGGGVQRVHFKDINGFVIYSLSLSVSLSPGGYGGSGGRNRLLGF